MNSEKFMEIIDEQRAESKRWTDLVVPVKELGIWSWDEESQKFENGRPVKKTIRYNQFFVGEKSYRHCDLALSQFLRKLDVNKKTFDNLTADVREEVVRDRINQIDSDVNYKLRIRKDQASDETIAGVVSPRYVPIEDHEILNGLIPLVEAGTLAIESHTRGHWMNPYSTSNYRFVLPGTKTDVGTAGVDDILSVGFHLSNSRVGLKSLTVNRLLWRLVCTNGLILPDRENIVRQRHIYFDRKEFLNRFHSEINFYMKNSDRVIKAFADTKDEWLGFSSTDSFQNAFNQIARNVPKYIADRALNIYRSQSTHLTVYGLINALTQAARDFDLSDADNVGKRIEIEAAIGSAIFS